MIQEIYIGVPRTNTYKPNTIEVTNDIEVILERVRVLLGTRKGEVLGDPDFGINLEDYLFDMKVPEQQIKKEVTEQFAKYITCATSPMYAIDVKVNFGKNVEAGYDYMVIDIYINQQKIQGFLIGA